MKLGRRSWESVRVRLGRLTWRSWAGNERSREVCDESIDDEPVGKRECGDASRRSGGSCGGAAALGCVAASCGAPEASDASFAIVARVPDAPIESELPVPAEPCAFAASSASAAFFFALHRRAASRFICRRRSSLCSRCSPVSCDLGRPLRRCDWSGGRARPPSDDAFCDAAAGVRQFSPLTLTLTLTLLTPLDTSLSLPSISPRRSSAKRVP